MEAELERRWEAGGLYLLTSYTDILFDPEANAKIAGFVRKKIREKIDAPELAELLVPKSYAFGSRRVCTDTNYFETFNRPNVKLVDVKSSPIVGVEETGLRTKDRLFELDMLVLATGFDALTGALERIDICGRDTEALRDRWAGGPLTIFGMMTVRFPNFFMVDCAHHPFTSYNTVPGVEFQTEWVTDLIEHMRRNLFSTVETTHDAEQWYTAHLQEVGAKTLLADGDNWYKRRQRSRKTAGSSELLWRLSVIQETRSGLGCPELFRISVSRHVVEAIGPTTSSTIGNNDIQVRCSRTCRARLCHTTRLVLAARVGDLLDEEHQPHRRPEARRDAGLAEVRAITVWMYDFIRPPHFHRHARTCSGHPRLAAWRYQRERARRRTDVDARNKSGHDEKSVAGLPPVKLSI